MNTEQQNLSGLALRKYAKQSYDHNSIVVSLMCGTKIFVRDENILADRPMLEQLIEDFGQGYCNLWTPKELLEIRCYLPEPAHTIRDNVIQENSKRILGEENYNLLNAICECRIPIPKDFPLELKEIASLVRYRYCLDNGLDTRIADLSEYPSDTSPQTETMQHEIIEPETPTELIQTNSKPEHQQPAKKRPTVNLHKKPKPVPRFLVR